MSDDTSTKQLMDQGKPFKFKLSLCLTHPTMPAGEISTALGMHPYSSGTVGESRKTPKGKSLGGLLKRSFWTSGYLLEGEAGELMPESNRSSTSWSPSARSFSGSPIQEDI
jgi:hypothetical protein